jgi:predicted alpha/beta-hydrolase family hydrolase
VRRFDAAGEASTARIYRAAAATAEGGAAGRTLVLAHGAGAPQLHPFMVAFATGLAARGVDVVTFDFLYAAAGRKLPDRGGKLEACWQAAWTLARAEWPAPRPLFAGGKSMGGRIASQLAAAGGLPDVAGLILLGYPLRPPGKDTLRAEHLPRLAHTPTLVLQGERDEFGGPEELRRHFPPSAHIVSVGGGHSFRESAWPDAIARVAEFVLADAGDAIRQ